MADIYRINIFSAQDLLNNGKKQPFDADTTSINACKLPSGKYTLGDTPPQFVDIVDAYNDVTPGQRGDAVDTFDDGTGARQYLGKDVTLTLDVNGTVTTRTFPAGSQVQAEFQLDFASGRSIVGLRIENPVSVCGPNSEPPFLTAGFSFVDEIPAPGTPLGKVVSQSDNVSIRYAEIPCFLPGTLILTPEGPRAVETLRVGDGVLTADNGVKRIRWTGRRDVGVADLTMHSDWRPIRVSADLVLSPLHRVLRRDAVLDLTTGESEMLVEARHLGLPPGDGPGQLPAFRL
ncbi:hypothetical protein JSE7799_00751 [Jannaschia seosinensis]|uniref:Hedgehog/Intein (Hint) domain-containing protein n=1 Tax=Jannaschia seosinensis TaxID=313367 RepID=A0A0M7B9W8_9RHOB|nr:Hint domain-containing protein [Jannaschia seosinensis]CUH26774.1 hypothetical protein JSE7799_00751 [Jannaschia seosinensis]